MDIYITGPDDPVLRDEWLVRLYTTICSWSDGDATVSVGREALARHMQVDPNKVYRGIDRLKLLGKISTARARQGRLNRTVITLLNAHTSDKKECQCEQVTSPAKRVRKVPDPLIVLPFQSQEFKEAWGRWLVYWVERKKPLPKSTQNFHVQRLAKWSEAEAISAINLSIASRWTGLFKPEPQGDLFNGRGLGTNSRCHSEAGKYAVGGIRDDGTLSPASPPTNGVGTRGPLLPQGAPEYRPGGSHDPCGNARTG